jgi:DNA-binding CsgD family transcriptional regulator
MGRVDQAIPLLQAAYAFGDARHAWMAELCARAAPILDMGLGVALAAFSVDEARNSRVDAFFQQGTPRDFTATAARLQLVSPREVVEASYLTPGFVRHLIAGHPHAPADQMAKAQAVLREAGISDIFGVGASATPRSGIVLNAPLAAGRESVDKASSALCRHVVAHLRCALRLYDRFDAAPEEAVLEPGTGRVLHAEVPAQSAGVQERLREHARAIDRASSRQGRSDPENALRIWRGLVDGTWSLIDRFDADGRHFMVARRNEPHALDPRRLAKREWQVSILCATGASNKQIAYELGVSSSTVSTLLSRAMRKLGCQNRVQLAEITQRAWRTPSFDNAAEEVTGRADLTA